MLCPLVYIFFSYVFFQCFIFYMSCFFCFYDSISKCRIAVVFSLRLKPLVFGLTAGKCFGPLWPYGQDGLAFVSGFWLGDLAVGQKENPWGPQVLVFFPLLGTLFLSHSHLLVHTRLNTPLALIGLLGFMFWLLSKGFWKTNPSCFQEFSWGLVSWFVSPIVGLQTWCFIFWLTYVCSGGLLANKLVVVGSLVVWKFGGSCHVCYLSPLQVMLQCGLWCLVIHRYFVFVLSTVTWDGI